MAQKDLMHLARNPKTAKSICTCFRQYDSWGIKLDAIEVFSRNWEAISQKMMVIRQSTNLILAKGVQGTRGGRMQAPKRYLHSGNDIDTKVGQRSGVALSAPVPVHNETLISIASRF